MKMDFNVADLFCGAGGTSTGVLQAAEELGINVHLVAVNHWEMAISTHSKNHPEVSHFNSDLQSLDPLVAVPSGKLRLLVASPECTHFSRARGGKPMSKQSRASIKWVVKWISVLDVEDLLIENVADFLTWGPLDLETKQPIKSRKGEYFHRFVRKLRRLGYTVDWRVLNAADYGDPTTRKRLFIMARKNNPIHWPEPTHHKNGGDMFGDRPRWRSAREIIDWKIKGESIFKRKKSLSDNTMRRIMAGLTKFGGKAFVIGQQSGAVPRDIDQPVPTVAGAGAIAFVEPFILSQFTSGAPRSVDDPLSTLTATSRGVALIEPYLVTTNWNQTNRSPARSVDDPMPTIMGHPTIGLAQPFIIPIDHLGMKEAGAVSVNSPMATITGKERFALVEPYIVEYHNGKNSEKRTKSVDEPLPTIDTSNRFGLAEPFLVEYYGTGGAASVEEPLKTQTGKDRFGLVEPIFVTDEDGTVYSLDILFRMLRPHELAGAMSFPEGYEFQGNREQVVKQIGNAVPVSLSKQLCKSLLKELEA